MSPLTLSRQTSSNSNEREFTTTCWRSVSSPEARKFSPMPRLTRHASPIANRVNFSISHEMRSEKERELFEKTIEQLNLQLKEKDLIINKKTKGLLILHQFAEKQEKELNKLQDLLSDSQYNLSISSLATQELQKIKWDLNTKQKTLEEQEQRIIFLQNQWKKTRIEKSTILQCLKEQNQHISTLETQLKEIKAQNQTHLIQMQSQLTNTQRQLQKWQKKYKWLGVPT